MTRNVFYHHKGLEINIIDLLTIDLCATLRLSWSKWSTHSRVLPSGSMEETQSMNEKALARDR